MALPSWWWTRRSRRLLQEFGINLNDMAREGKIDGVIGRDEKIER